ncbi:MAG: TonB-dependent receptor [Bacteroidales bacterium]|nr:TonB-dependent receptor [Bacteroidales bacterium]
MKITAIIGLMLLVSVQVFAQHTLTGTIYNSATGAPLEGANLIIRDLQKGTTSDNAGRFKLNGIPDGSYTITISYIGFRTYEQSVKMFKDADLEVQLEESAILSQEAVIRATRAADNEPITFQNLRKKDLEKSNHGQDLPFLLSESVSAVSTSDAGNSIGYSSLRIRGTDLTRINVTMNGIPLNDPESHNVFWVDLPDVAASSQSIQIQRGVGTSSNGAAAFGASINLLTSSISPDPSADIEAAIGSFNSKRVSSTFNSGLINKHFNFRGRVSSIASDGFIDRAASALFSYHLSGSYVGKKSQLTFNLLSGKEKTYQAWDGVPHEILDTNRTFNGMGSYYDTNGNLKFYENETDNYKQTHYQLLYSRILNEHLILNTALHYTKGAGYYEQYKDNDGWDSYGIQPIVIPGPFVVINTDTIHYPDSLINSSDLIRQKWLDNDFAGITYSLSWQNRILESSIGGSWNIYSGNHFGKIVWSNLSYIDPEYEWYRSKSTKGDLNLYAKTTLKLTQELNLFADMQLRRINYDIEGIDDDLRIIDQTHDYLFFNPKTGLLAKLNSKNDLYLSIAVANREPNRDNFVDADPSKSIPGRERLYDFESGHRYHNKMLSISSNIYYMLYRDQLILTGAINDVGAPVMENVPESYRLGLELSSQVKILKKIQWNFNGTVSRNKIKSYTEFVDDWDTWSQLQFEHKNTDISFSPAVVINNSVSWEISNGFSSELISKYVSHQYIDNTQNNSRSIDPYFINSLRLSYSIQNFIFREIRFNLMINNLFNQKYESNAWVYRYYESGSQKVMDGYFPQAGINFFFE